MSLETQDGSRVMKNYLTTFSAKRHDLMQKIVLLFSPTEKSKEDIIKKEIEEFISELHSNVVTEESSKELMSGISELLNDTIDYMNGDEKKWYLSSTIISDSKEMKHTFRKFKSLMEDVIFLENTDVKSKKDITNFLINISKFLKNNHAMPNLAG